MSPRTAILALAAASEVVYLAIAWFSQSFIFGEGFEQRPLLSVLLAFAVAFGFYVAAIAAAIRIQPGRWLTAAIFGPTLLFRVTLLFSQPIQEIDIYRYLWDGAAASQAVSPYRYSPAQVLAADAASPLPDDLAQLAALRDQSPALRTILGRIHYAELPTIYPPVSQAIFALTSLITPSQASVGQQVFIMRAVVTAFDLATVALIFRLLQLAGRHPGWAVAYAWCPLVIKEFANSGHADSIAVFFTTAAIYCLMETVCQSGGQRRSRKVWLAPLFLGLAVGVKLYPVVLVPWMLATCATTLGWRRAIAVTSLFAAISGTALLPMALTSSRQSTSQQASSQQTVADIANASPNPPLPDSWFPSTPPPQHDSLAGLRAFLRQWEMNDFLFMIVIENLRPTDAGGQQPPVWFSIIPESWRREGIALVERWLPIDDAPHASFLLARLVTTGAFFCVALWLAFRAARRPSPQQLLEAAFLTLAWFWLLLPTQNPWYWTWAMPLLPFARGRAWFAVSGLALVYYLRFWLIYHWPQQSVLGSAYNGAQFFDFVVTWCEFGPWFLWLIGESLLRRWRRA